MKKNALNLIQKADFNIQKGFLKPKKKRLSKLDICLKWAPLISLLVLDAFEDNAKEKLAKHIIDAATAGLLLNATVQPLKYIFKRTRPNGQVQSFPSNHAAISFLGSEMLRQELKDKQPVLSYSGYIISATTAVMRMYHNKHWFSDVLTGAALGVLSVKLSPKLMDEVIYNTNIQAVV